MTIDGCLKYYKALFFSSERMRELHSLLLSYCERIIYETETFNQRSIRFDSIDEMLSYDNYDKMRLKEIVIYGYSKNTQVFRLTLSASRSWFSLIGYWKTADCRYTFSNLQKETTFRSALQLFLKKATQPYWPVAKISIYGLFLFFCAFSSMYNFSIGKTVAYNGSFFLFFIALITAILLMLCFAALDFYVFGSLFPPIVFAWGEEAKRSDKNHARRSNIFWGIIVAIVVGIISSYLTGKFFT